MKNMPTMPKNEKVSLPGENLEEVVETAEVKEEVVEEITEIAVTATRKGFYGQHRKQEGSKFTVKKFEDLGSWMVCDDKATEKKRKEFFKNKKAN